MPQKDASVKAFFAALKSQVAKTGSGETNKYQAKRMRVAFLEELGIRGKVESAQLMTCFKEVRKKKKRKEKGTLVP